MSKVETAHVNNDEIIESFIERFCPETGFRFPISQHILKNNFAN